MPKDHRIKFDHLKAHADFSLVLHHYGLTVVSSGDQAKVRCPFHDDERPSCSVNLAKGLWHCFACHASGNVLDFVHRMETREGETVSLRQAGLHLAEICGLSRDQNRNQGRQEPRRAPTAKKTTTARIAATRSPSGIGPTGPGCCRSAVTAV